MKYIVYPCWIYVKINANLFLECRLKLCLQHFNKLTYPPVAFVILLPVTDKNIVIISFNYT